MKNIQKETAKMIIGASQGLAEVVASAAFEFWQRKDFRLYVDFDKLSKVEQDRMFNELEVSALGLFTLHLDYAVKISNEEEQRIVFRALRKDLGPGFIQILADVGIEKQYIDGWNKLIDMRVEEYTRDFKIAFKESSSMKEFEKAEQLRHSWTRIETITIDCLTHLRRGEVEKDDPLWELLRKWFIILDTQISPITTLRQEG